MAEGLGQRVAWITGGGSGIGREVALGLARQGWVVAVSGRNGAKLEEMAHDAPGMIYGFPLDVCDDAAVQVVYDEIVERFGKIDLAMLNAAVYVIDSAEHFSRDRVYDTMMTNVMGVANCLDRLLPSMLARRAGRLLVVGSIAGYGGLPGGAAYGASKAALINMCEALYPELKQKGVQLSIVNPGFVATPLTRNNDFPMPFIMSAAQAAGHILRAIPKDKFEIAFPWQMVWATKLLARLPYRLQFSVTRRIIRRQPK